MVLYLPEQMLKMLASGSDAEVSLLAERFLGLNNYSGSDIIEGKKMLSEVYHSIYALKILMKLVAYIH